MGSRASNLSASATRMSSGTSSSAGSWPHTTTTRSAWRPSCARASAREAASMLDIEVIGVDALGSDGPTAVEVEELCTLVFSSAGIEDGHLAIEFVDEERIRDLNRDYRGKDEPTD